MDFCVCDIINDLLIINIEINSGTIKMNEVTLVTIE